MFLCLATFLPRLVPLDGLWLVAIQEPQVHSGEGRREGEGERDVTLLRRGSNLQVVFFGLEKVKEDFDVSGLHLLGEDRNERVIPQSEAPLLSKHLEPTYRTQFETFRDLQIINNERGEGGREGGREGEIK